MLEQTSKEFRAFFLLQFTRELIRYSKEEEFLKSENILETPEEETKKEEIKLPEREFREKIHEKIKIIEKFPPLTKTPVRIRVPPKTATLPRPRQNQPLRIPELRLPPRLQYIRPIPTERSIDLGKLNPLIRDPLSRSIECNGQDKNILVRLATGQTKTTKVILSKEEINQVIEKFSITAKIPMGEGVFKVVVGKLILSAIVSEVIGSKFIIRKITYGPGTGSPMRSMLQRPRGYR